MLPIWLSVTAGTRIVRAFNRLRRFWQVGELGVMPGLGLCVLENVPATQAASADCTRQMLQSAASADFDHTLILFV